MRDNIINVLKNSDKALDIYELEDILELHEVDEIQELIDELRTKNGNLEISVLPFFTESREL